MDVFNFLVFSVANYFNWSALQPKIEVRLLSSFPNNSNKITIEIENISNNLITLEPDVIISLSNKLGNPHNLILKLTEKQLNFPSFSPQRIIISISEKNNKGLIRYFEFNVVGKKKIKVKITKNG